MPGHTELLFSDEARSKLLAGATALANAVRPTLGPESRSVLLAKRFGNPTVCDDGVTIAKQINLVQKKLFFVELQNQEKTIVKTGINPKRLRAGWDNEYLRKVIAGKKDVNTPAVILWHVVCAAHLIRRHRTS